MPLSINENTDIRNADVHHVPSGNQSYDRSVLVFRRHIPWAQSCSGCTVVVNC